MRILTVDTSDRSTVGIVEAGTALEEIAYERSADARRHAESLAPMVERAIEGHRPGIIVAGTGPAAFTDLRAGLVIAHALSHAWGVPLCGVSPLEALALNGAIRRLDDILAVTDARRREFFILRAHPLGPDDVAVVSDPEITARADLHAGPETAIVTPNPDLCPELDDTVTVECHPEYLTRRILALLAHEEASEDVRLDIEPRYLRRSDAHGT